MSEQSRWATEGRELAGDDLDLGGISRALIKRKSWIAGATVMALIGALAFDFGVTPRYTADSQVLIENQESFLTRADAAGPETPPDDAAVASQIQLLTSRDLARQAIAKLGLGRLVEFNPHAQAGLFGRLFSLVGLARSPNAITEEDTVLKNYYDRLNVYQVAKSRVLSIDFTSSDPELAARASNMIADLYIAVQISAKRQDAQAAASSLSQQIDQLQKQLADVEGRAESFRAANGLLIGANNTTLSSQQLADLNTQLSAARAAQADASAKAKMIRDAVGRGRLDDVSEVASNDLVRQLSVQRGALRAQMASLSKTLLPRHPQIVALNAQLADVEAQLKAAATNAARALENDARVAEARSENIQATLDQQQRQVGDQGGDQVRMRGLDRQAKALSDQLDASNAKYQEALARQSATSMPGDARVISRAIAPELPSFPHKMPTIIFAVLAGLVLSAAAAISAELLSDSSQRSKSRDAEGDAEADAEKDVAAPVEREVPLRVTEQLRAEKASPKANRPPQPERPAFAEVRTPRWNLKAMVVKGKMISAQSERAAALLVVGVSEEDPAGEVAVELARALATEGRSILVELTSGLLAEAGLIPPDMLASGLGDLVEGRRSFAEVIDRDDESRMHFIVAGSEDASAGEALDVAIEALGSTYDFVVLLGAPLDDGALTREVAGAADLVALVGGETREQIEDLRLKFLRIGAGEAMAVEPGDGRGRISAA